jgi:hypothetical protein
MLFVDLFSKSEIIQYFIEIKYIIHLMLLSSFSTFNCSGSCFVLLVPTTNTVGGAGGVTVSLVLAAATYGWRLLARMFTVAVVIAERRRRSSTTCSRMSVAHGKMYFKMLKKLDLFP